MYAEFLGTDGEPIFISAAQVVQIYQHQAACCIDTVQPGQTLYVKGSAGDAAARLSFAGRTGRLSRLDDGGPFEGSSNAEIALDEDLSGPEAATPQRGEAAPEASAPQGADTPTGSAR